MKGVSINGWQDVQTEVLRRLHDRFWKPGDLLPSEADLAAEFGCARTTVNRALQAIAEEGLLERRRRGGTRVVINPERRATFNIPVIRLEIEQLQCEYGYQLLKRRQQRPSKAVQERMQVEADARIVFLRALHTADGKPYVVENRWIDLAVVPAAADADFNVQSPNEWLVEHVPFSGGDLVLSAQSASEEDAGALGCEKHAAVFMAERRTRNTQDATITVVRLVYAPGYRMAIDL
ncbi:GntR family transcriptional regulator [Granulosicoccus sp. 3-233]|uniref:GntR family transcriptional regulator n=1 Tax=Granulosicoccus sp. 3-233 TaxID=3417969 RepID=UPI003D341540